MLFYTASSVIARAYRSQWGRGHVYNSAPGKIQTCGLALYNFFIVWLPGNKARGMHLIKYLGSYMTIYLLLLQLVLLILVVITAQAMAPSVQVRIQVHCLVFWELLSLNWLEQMTMPLYCSSVAHDHQNHRAVFYDGLFLQ